MPHSDSSRHTLDTSAQTALVVSRSAFRGLTHLRISGELDAASSRRLARALERPDEGHALLVVVDMRAVGSLDACAVQVLLDAQQAIRSDGGRMVILRGPVLFDRWPALTGLDTDLEITAVGGAHHRSAGAASQIDPDPSHTQAAVIPDVEPASAANEVDMAPLRLAQRLHDGPLQLLAVARQELEQVPAPSPEQQRTLELLGQASTQIRQLLSSVTSPLTTAAARGVLLQWGALTLGADASISVEIDDRIETVVELALDTARELMSNAARHGDCRAVDVRFAPLDDDLLIEVVDDGRGMAAGWQPGYGLGTLAGRLQAAGGSLDHHAAVPSGTRAIARLPTASA